MQVTESAVLKRVNRALASQGEKVRKQRGDYNVIDVSLNAIVHEGIDLEALAKDLGVLKSWETLAAQ